MNSIDSLKWRYAAKKFDENKQLSDDKVSVLKEAFTLTPTSYGLQPLKLVVVRDKAIQQQLAAQSFNQQQVAQASHVLVICIEKRIDAEYIKKCFENEKNIRGTKDEVLAPFRNFLTSHFSSKTPAEITEWATRQAYIALGNLLTVCAAEKIDACPMEGFLPEKYNEILKLSAHNISSVLVLPVGYRAADDMFSELKKVRKSVAENTIDFPTFAKK